MCTVWMLKTLNSVRHKGLKMNVVVSNCSKVQNAVSSRASNRRQLKEVKSVSLHKPCLQVCYVPSERRTIYHVIKFKQFSAVIVCVSYYL